MQTAQEILFEAGITSERLRSNYDLESGRGDEVLNDYLNVSYINSRNLLFY